MSQVQIPANKEDRDKFKMLAVKKGMTMKALFHEWVERDGEEEA